MNDLHKMHDLIGEAGYEKTSQEAYRIRYYVRRLPHEIIKAYKNGRKAVFCTRENFEMAMKMANVSPPSAINVEPACAAQEPQATIVTPPQPPSEIPGYIASLREAAEAIGVPDSQLTPARLNAAVRDRFGVDVLAVLHTASQKT